MKIGLLGHGVVGSGVARIIDAGETEYSKGMEVVRILVRSESEMNDSRCTTNVDEILNDEAIDTVCECMGGLEPSHSYVKHALESGKNVVTSNKKMLATFFEDLLACAEDHHVHLCYEATAGGGIPWMSNLARIRRIEPVKSFRGIFNGTTNYILDQMTKNGSEFDAVLKDAQLFGYAERDPADDIDGIDVQCKTMLSAAAGLGVLIPLNQIPVFGIRTLSSRDIAWAACENRTIKLIGSASVNGISLSCSVMPCALRNDDYFSRIPLNINAIESVSETLGTAGFTGQGAGSLPTAHAVVQDLIDIEKGETAPLPAPAAARIDNSVVVSQWYIRTAETDQFDDLAERKAGENAVVTRAVSLPEIRARISSCKDQNLFMMEVQE